MKILYLPILEPGAFHARAVANKRGLYTALAKAGHQVTEYDYLDGPRGSELAGRLAMLYKAFSPDLVISQLHGADVVTAEMIDYAKSVHGVQWINWSGDSHRHSLLGEAMVALMKKVDWMLVPTLDVLPDLEAAGVKAAYWNIAYEPVFKELPPAQDFDVVFQGNVFNDQRRELVKMLRGLPLKVGIFGDWEFANGNTSYDFATQQALYKRALVAVADNYRPDDLNYVSDRPMTIMASNGAVCLHQRVETMQELTGWRAGSHYVEWSDLEDLQRKIEVWIQPEYRQHRKTIAERAMIHALQNHSFTARVKELFEKWVRE